VAIPCEESEYISKYKEIESYLGQVKNLRHFEQLEELGRKCSLSGEMNALFAKYKSRKNIELNPKNAGGDTVLVEEFNEAVCEVNKKHKHYLKEKEGLSAIGLVKRFYKLEKFKENEEGFPSTAKVALLNFIESEHLQDKIKEYEALFNYFHFDEQLFFDENMTDKYLDELERKDDIKTKLTIQEKKIIRDTRKELFELAENKGVQTTKYYALLSFDGDKMGEKLDNVKNKEEHQRISEALATFASEAKTYLNEENRGKTIYAGGDDFLGFVNLHSLFEVLHQLRIDFDSKVAKAAGIKNFTFSAGVVIAHYKTPLREVIKQAKAMEKVAKDKGGRDALAIRVMKHAGEINQAYCKWNLDTTQNQSTVLKLKKIYHQLSFEGGMKVVKTLENTFANLMNYDTKDFVNGDDK
jgi:CRISPR-associated protein Cmr2